MRTTQSIILRLSKNKQDYLFSGRHLALCSNFVMEYFCIRYEENLPRYIRLTGRLTPAKGFKRVWITCMRWGYSQGLVQGCIYSYLWGKIGVLLGERTRPYRIYYRITRAKP